MRTSSQSRTKSPERCLPMCRRGRERRLRETVRRSVGVGVEGRPRIARGARPPPHRDLFCSHCVSSDEVVGRRGGRLAGEQVDREVERSPPGIHRGEAPPRRCTECLQDQCGASRRGDPQAPAAGVPPSRGHRHAVHCAVTAAQAAPACLEPAYGHEACRTSCSTPHTEALARPLLLITLHDLGTTLTRYVLVESRLV